MKFRKKISYQNHFFGLLIDILLFLKQKFFFISFGILKKK
jgi:hypothetical protein